MSTTFDPKKIAKLIDAARKTRIRLAEERDKLRGIHAEIEAVLDSVSGGIEDIESGLRDIESGIDQISELL